MNEIFILIVANKIDIECCEVFDDQKLAANTAISIAKIKSKDHLDWINENPAKEKIVDGFKWVFLNTSHKTIIVFSKTIIPTITVDEPSTKAQHLLDGYFISSSSIKDNPEDRDLPAGWDYNNKPVLMSELIDNPDNIKQYDKLTEHQLRALVIARIRKRPAFSIFIPSYGNFLQSKVLTELDYKSLISDFVINQEIDWLSNYLCNKKYCL